MLRRWRLGVLVLIVLFSVSGFSYADKDFDKRDRDESSLKDLGEFLGWGTVAIALSAGTLFLLRRIAKNVNKKFPSIRNIYKKILRFFTKYHPLLGLTALLLGAGHGTLMFLDKGELEVREWIGLFALGLMASAAIFGLSLKFMKKQFKLLRKFHIGLLSIAGILLFVHIITA